MVFPNRSSHRKGRRHGATAAELALLLPMLVLVLVGAVDFCRLFFHYTTITNAARNGTSGSATRMPTARSLPLSRPTPVSRPRLWLTPTTSTRR